MARPKFSKRRLSDTESNTLKFSFQLIPYSAREMACGPKENCFWDGMNLDHWVYVGFLQSKRQQPQTLRRWWNVFHWVSKNRRFKMFSGAVPNAGPKSPFPRIEILEDCAGLFYMLSQRAKVSSVLILRYKIWKTRVPSPCEWCILVHPCRAAPRTDQTSELPCNTVRALPTPLLSR